MRRKNSGFILPLLILVVIVVIASVAITAFYFYKEHNRELQISTFKQFVTGHSYPLTIGTVSFTNVITLDLNAFEQKCIALSSESNFGIIEQHTHSWLVLPQEKFTVVDWQTNTAYQWIV
jgi:hypothetical protein